MSISGGDEPSRESHVQARLAGLEREITHLEEAVSALSSRLNFVCRDEADPENLIPKSDKAKEPIVPCELANILREFDKRVARVREKAEYRLSVLEI